MKISSFFASTEQAPRDPILGLNEAYGLDDRTEKVNLGVGVYYNEEGKVPLLQAVKHAEEQRLRSMPARAYQPIDGPVRYQQAVQTLLFGADAAVIEDGRVITAEALGGTGALRIGADLVHYLKPQTAVYISDPSWENHRALFTAAGFSVHQYGYYDAATHGVNFEAMVASFKAMPAGSLVVLHGCCHNPTGADLTVEQWQAVVELCRERDLLPLIDIAYQGFAEGIREDGAVLRLFADSGLSFMVANSFSKTFSLYGERVGGLSIVCSDRAEAGRVLSQLKRVIRTNYSNPPTHGGAVVADVLLSPELRQLWEDELTHMRQRIRKMRSGLLEGLQKQGTAGDFSFITEQRGMFSYTGLSAVQVERLRDEFGIYAVSSGRICLAALNDNNLDYVARAIAAVTQNA